MTIPFVDTDVLVRLLTGDDLTKQRSVQAMFDSVASGQLLLAAPDTVIADAVFVLTSRRLYNLPRSQVQSGLSRLLSIPNFRVENRRTLIRALDIFASTNLDFGDSMVAASMASEGSTAVCSYDRDFDRLPGVTRREPAAAGAPPNGRAPASSS